MRRLSEGTASGPEDRCASCANFRRHVYFPYLGLCDVWGTVVTEDTEICGSFTRATQDELRRILAIRGWLYCTTCRRVVVTDEELAKHGHGLAVAYVDEVVSEEAPPGD